MGNLLIKDKSVVVPGEILADGMDFIPAQNSFRENDKIISNVIGVVSISGRLIKVIPLRGKYNSKVGDTVIGRIIDMTFNNWYIDIGCANNAVLSVREATEFVERGADLSHYYTYEDIICARVSNVTRSTIELSMKGPGLRKLIGGKLIKVDPSKVPRIIGKQGSMIGIIKEKTGCKMIVGQNGLVWIQGEPDREIIASEIIELINREAHKEGLTDKITNILHEKLGNVGDKNEGKK